MAFERVPQAFTPHRRLFSRGVLAGVLATLAIFFPATSASALVASHQPPSTHWVAAWIASPQASATPGRSVSREYSDQTVRQVVRVQVSGQTLRVRLSNDLGPAPLWVGAASVALAATGGAIAPDSVVPLTFDGQTSVILPPGAPIYSDPIALPVERAMKVAVSIYYPGRVQPDVHRQTVFVSTSGDHTTDALMPFGGLMRGPGLVSGIEVATEAPPARVFVAFGDSITEGGGSTNDAEMDWPSQLSRLFAVSPDTRNWVILNAGIGGNRLLGGDYGPGALARFDRDALSQPGLTDIVLLEGVNDIAFLRDPARGGPYRSPDDLIAAQKQLVVRARTRGVRIYGATIPPYITPGHHDPRGETDRLAFNAWIRSTDVFDGVIDFDAAMRDGRETSAIVTTWQSGDRIHPNDAGYAVMAAAAQRALTQSSPRR